MQNILQEVGINAGLIVSGLFGSLLTIKKGHATRLSSVALSIAAGVGSANYITPVVVDSLNLTNQNLTFGIAFILGFLGLSGIDFAIKKLMPDMEEQTAPKRKPSKRKAAKKKTSGKKKPRG
jgi:hypothetical protein